ncbi:CsgG/HfaB family protein [Salegentibacter sp. F188]|uniref:CsgG/HfaB family protein n=1 Tax=Autumnicola patrickiae TaxID=3075591 RepID=A0ABU3E0W9_9FLAO|nr:CsgG/HfaB family protein [Salegentibacter sp. F188]MDT0689560.1 CsgG/HfaB family protein [Salegentibacter sp. F188]
MNFFRIAGVILLTSVTLSCGTYFNQPVDVTEARIGETSKVTERLRTLPLPQEPVVVGVYNFRDLTGQYKPSDVGSTFSTAVTQGATSILIKALEDSRWFTPIERENIGNLLNERNIIRSTRQEYQAGGDQNQPQVPPLLYAGILLEGGIVSYDTNIITGGMGARYFGVGSSTQYRQDRITIYLRAISTSSGKILKNIYISKTILSQALDVSLYKYVSFQRLLEVETGFTRNEPVQVAVKEAIEKAVEGLIVEGLKDDLWSAQEGEEVSAQLISDYEAEKEDSDLTGLYNRKFIQRNYNNSFGLDMGATIMRGDYSGQEAGAHLTFDYTTGISKSLFLNVSASGFELKNENAFSRKLVGLDLNGGYLLLPNDKISPYLYGGSGVIMGVEEAPEDQDNIHLKFQYGIGAEYLLNDKLGLKIFAQHNLAFDDEVDYLINGKRNDQFFNFGIGVNFYLGSSSQSQNN